MHASGFRLSTSQPGHHQTAIQTLALTLDVPSEDWRVLNGLRRNRNANDYEGDLVTSDMVAECRKQAEVLRHRLKTFLQEKHPELLMQGMRP